jgi:hypothetical protein
MAWIGNCTKSPPRRGYWSASKDDCQNFPTPCPDIDKDWFDCTDGPSVTQGGCAKDQNADHWGMCSGDWTLGMVADRVVVPQVQPGKYVVGWRHDCEETAQIWRAGPY